MYAIIVNILLIIIYREVFIKKLFIYIYLTNAVQAPIDYIVNLPCLHNTYKGFRWTLFKLLITLFSQKSIQFDLTTLCDTSCLRVNYFAPKCCLIYAWDGFTMRIGSLFMLFILLNLPVLFSM